jgi:hypothetical protein
VKNVDEFKNELGTENTVGVLDEIGIDQIKEQIEQLSNEINGYEKVLEQKQKDFDNFKEQYDIAQELWDLEIENYGITPEKYSHKVHYIPRFWELKKKEHEYKIRMEKFQNDKYIESLSRELEVGIEQMNNLKEQKIVLEKQLDGV